jgi:hypothetical protein
MKRRALLLSGGVSPKLDRPYYANDVVLSLKEPHASRL